MIRFADGSDFDALKEIWHICFGDGYEYIDKFFNERLESVLLCETEGKIVSALHLLECECVISERSYSALYIYAAATLPEHRGRGYMGEIINYAKRSLPCDFLLLAPAEETLFDYYKRFGFERAFKNEFLLVPNAEYRASAEPKKAGADEIFNLRCEYLDGYNYIKWSKRAIEYALSDCTLALTLGKAYIIGYETDDYIEIIEAVGEKRSLCELLNTQAAKGKRCKVRLPCPSDLFPDGDFYTADTAMLLPLNDKAKKAFALIAPTAYFSLDLR